MRGAARRWFETHTFKASDFSLNDLPSRLDAAFVDAGWSSW